MTQQDKRAWRTGEAEMALDRIDAACKRHPIDLESVLKSAEFVAACTSYGLNPQDVLLNGVRAYPHLMQLMGEVWDVQPVPEALNDGG